MQDVNFDPLSVPLYTLPARLNNTRPMLPAPLNDTRPMLPTPINDTRPEGLAWARHDGHLSPTMRPAVPDFLRPITRVCESRYAGYKKLAIYF